MSKNLDELGLKSIADDYDIFFIDIWGVIHNGINLYQASVEALNQIEKLDKRYVLLTNAPRPNKTVIEFLKKMGLDDEKCKQVYTSGESALKYLEDNLKTNKFFHIGPPQDFDLFKLFKKNKINSLKKSDFILCTGLFENYEKDLNYYKDLFKNFNNKKMICTNPDLIVDRGDTREYCAGSVAKIFEELGGDARIQRSARLGEISWRGVGHDARREEEGDQVPSQVGRRGSVEEIEEREPRVALR